MSIGKSELNGLSKCAVRITALPDVSEHYAQIVPRFELILLQLHYRPISLAGLFLWPIA
jgi:hypothetical protein